MPRYLSIVSTGKLRSLCPKYNLLLLFHSFKVTAFLHRLAVGLHQ
jgi:hypothetical protein